MLKEKVATIFPERSQIPKEVSLQLTEQKEYLVNGALITWTGEPQQILSPVCIREEDKITQQLIGTVPNCTEREALAALDAALTAYDNGRGAWPTMSVEKRIGCMLDFCTRMKAQKAKVTNLLMWEIGKSKKDSEKEFDRTITYIEATISALKDLDRVSSKFEIEEGIIAQIRRAPLGVVLCMGPFNYPLNETFTTLIPALIMGNTILFKPAKYGVLLISPLLEAFRDAFPKGVVNTVYGEGKRVIGPLMATGKIDVLAFIGSATTANTIERQHPYPNRLKTVYGLNAKNPGIVLDDADLDLALKECMLGTLSFNGQRCTALKILFVHRKIVDEFLSRFAAMISALKAGMPWEENVEITPLPETNKTAWLTSFIDDAIQLGAKVINESGGATNETFFFPALVYPVNEKMKLYKEEQFGPIIPVVPFDDINTPIDYIISSNYGQQASIFSKNPDTIARLVDPLSNQLCRININCQCQRGPDVYPFTGRKDSAEGTLSVSDALRVFSIRTLVAAKEGDLNKEIINKIVRERKSNFLTTDFIL
jgi:glyceraldehyde-3-phosphate dehydrogenase (NADP+)